jgi:hypothetical protein
MTAEETARRWGHTATAYMLRDWEEPSQVRAEATYRNILSCNLKNYTS